MSRDINAWDKKFMGLAQYISDWSKDRSTKVGCVIVGPQKDVRALGYNGFPRGIDDDMGERHERPAKYLWTEHAERNAIYNAASTGVPLSNCTVYVPWFPCMDCARAIIQSGISTLVAHESDWTDSKWNFGIVKGMLEEAGIELILMDKESNP